MAIEFVFFWQLNLAKKWAEEGVRGLRGGLDATSFAGHSVSSHGQFSPKVQVPLPGVWRSSPALRSFKFFTEDLSLQVANLELQLCR